MDTKSVMVAVEETDLLSVEGGIALGDLNKLLSDAFAKIKAVSEHGQHSHPHHSEDKSGELKLIPL